jgi:hypothetical protein
VIQGSEWMLIVVPIVLFWIIPAFVVASIAKSKDRSYFGFLFFSLLVGWVITGLIVLAVKK